MNAIPAPTPAAKGADFQLIYEQHVAFVWRCLRANGVPEQKLDDACQEVFLGLYTSLASFREESTLRTFLYGIVRNVAYKQRRRGARKERTEELVTEPIDPGSGPDERAQELQAAAFVQAFAGGLDDHRRDVFVLALVEGLSIPEVATILNVPLNTAYTRLRAVKTQFREALESARLREAR